jgi:hypothetical protein
MANYNNCASYNRLKGKILAEGLSKGDILIIKKEFSGVCEFNDWLINTKILPQYSYSEFFL